MKSELTFNNPDGTIESVPMLHLELNPKQQCVLLGLAFEDRPTLEPFSIPGVEIQKIGKLDEQNFIFKAQLNNSLFMFRWDFTRYPNPEILLLTDNRLEASKLAN